MARLRPILVWMVTLAFVVSGAAWQKCAAAQFAAASSSHAYLAPEHDHAASAHHHAHEHHQGSHAVDVDNAPPGAHNDHDCAKCCGICGITAATLPGNPFYEPLAGALVLAIQPQDGSGSSVAVDPGIPKHLV